MATDARSHQSLNLDRAAAIYAQRMVNAAEEAKNVATLERLVTKTLGVLQEQGVYAAILFLFSRTGPEKDAAPHIRASLFRLLHDGETGHHIPGFGNAPADDAAAKEALAYYTQHVLQDLDTLLLVRDLYEQTLIYARYGAKAANEQNASIPEQPADAEAPEGGGS